MEFKMRLAELLERKGMKQADLCRAAQISTALLSQYSTGKSSPTLEKAKMIARALDVTLDELVGWKPREVEPTQEIKCTADEAELIRKFRFIDKRAQKVVLRNLNAEYEDALLSVKEDALNTMPHG